MYDIPHTLHMWCNSTLLLPKPQAWQDACISSRQGRQHIKSAAARVCRETLRLVWYTWHHLGKAEKAQRMLMRMHVQTLKLLASRNSRHMLHLIWKTWVLSSKFMKASARRDFQLRRLGMEASEALRSVWRCGQTLVLFRSWHWLTVAHAFDNRQQQLQIDLQNALLRGRVLEGAHAARSNDARHYSLAMIFGRWRDFVRMWRLKCQVFGPKKLLQEIWLLWVCYIQQSQGDKEHHGRYEKQSEKLRNASVKATSCFQMLSKSLASSASSASFHAWAMLLAKKRNDTLRTAQRERHFEGQVMAWCQRGVRKLCHDIFGSWCSYFRGRQLMNRITQLTYLRILEKDATILRDCYNFWNTLMLRRRHGCDKLQLQQLQHGRAALQFAFQCWLYFMAMAVQAHLGTQTKARSEQLLQSAAIRKSRQELRCVFLAWLQHLRAAHRVDASLALAQSEVEWLSHACYSAWRVATMLGAQQNHEARLQQRRQWAESARQDRYLLRHCVSAWRGEILDKYRQETRRCNKEAASSKVHVLQLQDLLSKERRNTCYRDFYLPAILACWRNEAVVRSRSRTSNAFLLSTCMLGWKSHWSSHRHIATTKMLRALEKLSARLLREKSLQLCKQVYHAWCQARASAENAKLFTWRMLNVRRRGLSQIFFYRWLAAMLMKRQRRLQHFKFQMQAKTSRDLNMTRALTFYHWRGALSPARVYAYNLLLKCLGHRTLLDLVFRCWRSVIERSEPTRLTRLDGAGQVADAADEMLELCKCLETQNADLLLLLQERANANALLEVELQESRQPTQPGNFWKLKAAFANVPSKSIEFRDLRGQ